MTYTLPISRNSREGAELIAYNEARIEICRQHLETLLDADELHAYQGRIRELRAQIKAMRD